MQAASSTSAFECLVCFERYNESDHAPKFLPCGHSCCFQCTKDLFAPRNSITCPSCRNVSTIQPTSLPTNYGILAALPSISVQTRVSLCPKHNNKMDIYCSNCRVCVCSSCFFKDHKGHEGMEVPDDALSQMESSSAVLSKLDVVCGKISAAVNHLNAVEVNLVRKESDMAASIHQSFNQIRAAVDAREEALISSLPSKRLAVESQKHHLESFLTHVQTSTQSFRNLLLSSDVVPFLSSREAIVPVLSRLDEETKSTDIRVKYDSNLSLICDNSDIIRSINQFVQLDGSNAIMMPCQNELESRRTVVNILKQTRGILTWNAPDDKGNQLNWSEVLPLSEWDGIAPDVTPAMKRVQVDGNGKITRLFLNYLGMRGIFPDSIANLTSLIQLCVENNKLTHIPDSVGQLTSLSELWLHNNQLSSIPDSIGKLTSLTQLYVGGNPLTRLPDWIGNLRSLTDLWIHNNQLSMLPDWLVKLTSLRRFYANHNRLTRIPDWIGNFKSLVRLYVNNNQLSMLPDSFGNLTSLTWLYISNNQLSVIPDWIGNFKSLTKLSINNNKLSQLPDSINTLTSLTELNIGGNPITSTQAGKDEVNRRFGRAGLTINV